MLFLTGREEIDQVSCMAGGLIMISLGGGGLKLVCVIVVQYGVMMMCVGN